MAKKKPPTDDSVGYGRPPKAHQFKPGQSGNPPGRPKKKASKEEIATAALAKIVTVTIDGRRVKMSVLELVIKKQVQLALSGDKKALQFLLSLNDPALMEPDSEYDPEYLMSLSAVELSELYMQAVKREK